MRAVAEEAMFGGAFPESLVNDVVPYIEKNYRVIANKDGRAIAGLSMGGGHTLAATNAHPDVFSYVGVFSMGTAADITDKLAGPQEGRREVLLCRPRQGRPRRSRRPGPEPCRPTREGRHQLPFHGELRRPHVVQLAYLSERIRAVAV